MKFANALLLSLLGLATIANAAAPAPTTFDFKNLPERDVAVICGYSLSEGAVILARSKSLMPEERADAVRHFVAAAEYWHFRAGQLHATEQLMDQWADKLAISEGIEEAQYKYCGATAARRTEALAESEQDAIRVATTKTILSILAKYGVQ